MCGKECAARAHMGYELVYQGLQLKLGKIISNLAKHDQIELSGGMSSGRAAHSMWTFARVLHR